MQTQRSQTRDPFFNNAHKEKGTNSSRFGPRGPMSIAAKNKILSSAGGCPACFISMDWALKITFTAFDRNAVD
jgi:hypothetical protein